MTQSEKLQALIQKAIENGFKPDSLYHHPTVNIKDFQGLPIKSINVDSDRPNVSVYFDAYYGEPKGPLNQKIGHLNFSEVIFNHNFARALFGEIQIGTQFVKGIYSEQPIYSWQNHLKEAVISSDPIDYLYKAVFNDN